jgi:hypothetical protein
MGYWLGPDDGADESTSPQAGINSVHNTGKPHVREDHPDPSRRSAWLRALLPRFRTL